MKVYVTFDKYDKTMEELEKKKTTLTFPSVDEIDLMRENPKKYWKFASYLEMHLKPVTNEEKYSCKNLKAFLRECLELIDEEDLLTRKGEVVA